MLDHDRILAGSFVKQVEAHRVLASTNDRALELAGQRSLETPHLVIAEEQTAGRGRGTNRWWSGPGALTFSLVLEPHSSELSAEQWPRVALVAGLSVCDVLEQAAPQTPCHIKWPNDVLLDGRKVCGILVEIPPARADVPRRLVMGIGINVNNSLVDAPSDIQARATSLCDTGARLFDTTELLVHILRRLETNLRALSVRDPQLAAEWQQRCALRGKSVAITHGENVVQGTCGGITAEGALVIETFAGQQHIWGGVLTVIE